MNDEWISHENGAGRPCHGNLYVVVKYRNDNEFEGIANSFWWIHGVAQHELDIIAWKEYK